MEELKLIFKELELIRKELQSIRSAMESFSTLSLDNQLGKIFANLPRREVGSHKE